VPRSIVYDASLMLTLPVEMSVASIPELWTTAQNRRSYPASKVTAPL
jgi:hypothetical protein